MGPWNKITSKPVEQLTSMVPNFHYDLLTKAFLPIDAGQHELRVDCRILMVMPGAHDQYHFHKKTIALFTVIEGEIDVIVNDERMHLAHGQTILFNTLEKHAFVACSDQPCILSETRINVHEEDRYHCDEHEPQGKSATRFATA